MAADDPLNRKNLQRRDKYKRILATIELKKLVKEMEVKIITERLKDEEEKLKKIKDDVTNGKYKFIEDIYDIDDDSMELCTNRVLVNQNDLYSLVNNDMTFVDYAKCGKNSNNKQCDTNRIDIPDTLGKQSIEPLNKNI